MTILISALLGGIMKMNGSVSNVHDSMAVLSKQVISLKRRSSSGASSPGTSKKKGVHKKTKMVSGTSRSGPAQGSQAHGSSSVKGSQVQGSLAQGSLAQGSLAQGSVAHGSLAQGSLANGSLAEGAEAQECQEQGSQPRGSKAPDSILRSSQAHCSPSLIAKREKATSVHAENEEVDPYVFSERDAPGRDHVDESDRWDCGASGGSMSQTLGQAMSTIYDQPSQNDLPDTAICRTCKQPGATRHCPGCLEPLHSRPECSNPSEFAVYCNSCIRVSDHQFMPMTQYEKSPQPQAPHAAAPNDGALDLSKSTVGGGTPQPTTPAFPSRESVHSVIVIDSSPEGPTKEPEVAWDHPGIPSRVPLQQAQRPLDQVSWAQPHSAPLSIQHSQAMAPACLKQESQEAVSFRGFGGASCWGNEDSRVQQSGIPRPKFSPMLRRLGQNSKTVPTKPPGYRPAVVQRPWVVKEEKTAMEPNAEYGLSVNEAPYPLESSHDSPEQFHSAGNVAFQHTTPEQRNTTSIKRNKMMQIYQAASHSQSQQVTPQQGPSAKRQRVPDDLQHFTPKSTRKMECAPGSSGAGWKVKTENDDYGPAPASTGLFSIYYL